jgi:predicted dehydrogenase
MTITSFIIMGLGWRSRKFAAVAAALPDRFRCAGVLRRRADGSEGRLPVFTDIGQAAVAGADFVLIALPWAEMPGAIAAWAGRGVPVLAETPPAPDAAGLVALWSRLGGQARVQVAEQLPFIPLHAAMQRVIDDGTIGRAVQAEVSVAHGYHGMVQIRKFLGTGLAVPRMRGYRHVAQVITGPGRNGPPTEERLGASAREVVALDFGDGRLGIHDFDGEQYFSWIRSSHLRVRGTRGEIDANGVRWLIDHRTPMQAAIERRDAGQRLNLEGHHLHGYVAAGRWLYRNPYAPAALSDDAIAMATVLDRMGVYARGGEVFYGLDEASHDHWLGLHAQQAIASGSEYEVPVPPWCGAEAVG